MRVVLDTNVLVAAIVARGTCFELWEHCATSHDLFTSPPLVVELVDALRRKTGLRPPQVAEAKRLLPITATIVTPETLPPSSCRDPDDVVVLATAAAARADCLISGDKDLLSLTEFRGTPILAPREFWAFEAGGSRPGPGPRP